MSRVTIAGVSIALDTVNVVDWLEPIEQTLRIDSNALN